MKSSPLKFLPTCNQWRNFLLVQTLGYLEWKLLLSIDHRTGMFVLTLQPTMCFYIGLLSLLSFISPHPFLSLPPIWHFVPPFHVILFLHPSSFSVVSFPSPSLSPAVGLDLKDFQNNKNRYLIASENQRPGHFSTAPLGSLTASPSSGSLSSQVGLQSVTSIQERIMSTPGGEEAIERLKVRIVIVAPKPRAVSLLERASLHLSWTHWRRWKLVWLRWPNV